MFSICHVAFGLHPDSSEVLLKGESNMFLSWTFGNTETFVCFSFRISLLWSDLPEFQLFFFTKSHSEVNILMCLEQDWSRERRDALHLPRAVFSSGKVILEKKKAWFRLVGGSVPFSWLCLVALFCMCYTYGEINSHFKSVWTVLCLKRKLCRVGESEVWSKSNLISRTSNSYISGNIRILNFVCWKPPVVFYPFEVLLKCFFPNLHFVNALWSFFKSFRDAA